MGESPGENQEKAGGEAERAAARQTREPFPTTERLHLKKRHEQNQNS
jgi:hypothetical protein